MYLKIQCVCYTYRNELNAMVIYARDGISW